MKPELSLRKKCQRIAGIASIGFLVALFLSGHPLFFILFLPAVFAFMCLSVTKVF